MKKLDLGFTLMELVVAIALATGILAMAGNGLIAIMGKDRQAAANRHNRYELQRTIDFLGQEIRMAHSLSPCPDTAAQGKYQPATGSSNAQPILLLYIKGLPEPIVYYLAAPPAKKQTVWQGPLLLYRWGPTLLLTGDYSKDMATNSYDYSNELVIDRVATQQLNRACPNADDQGIPSAHPAGFSLCLGPQGRSVRIALSRHSEQEKIITSTATFTTRSRSTTIPVCPAPGS